MEIKPPKLGLSLCNNTTFSTNNHDECDDENEDRDDYDLNNAAPFLSRCQNKQQQQTPKKQQQLSDYESVHNLKYLSVTPRIIASSGNHTPTRMKKDIIVMDEDSSCRSRSGSSRDLSSPDSAMILKSVNLKSATPKVNI